MSEGKHYQCGKCCFRVRNQELLCSYPCHAQALLSREPGHPPRRCQLQHGTQALLRSFPWCGAAHHIYPHMWSCEYLCMPVYICAYTYASVCSHEYVYTAHLYVSFLEITIKLVFSKQQVDCPTLQWGLPANGRH